MAIDTPKIKDLDEQTLAALESSIGQTAPLPDKAFNRILSKTLAATFILLFKYAGSMFLNIFVRTASFKPVTILGRVLTPLIEWGRLIGVGDPIAATQAELVIDVTVTNQEGQIDSDTQLVNSGNGFTYLVKVSVPKDADTIQINILAAADQTGGDGSGSLGNLQIGDEVQFANPSPGVVRTATVSAIAVSAANAEAEDVYRQKVIDRFAARIQGGAPIDYAFWGGDVAGVLNIYPYKSDDPGRIDAYSEFTVESSGNADGIPNASQLQAVLDSINLDVNGLASRRSANALANSFPISRTGFNVEVVGLTAPNLSSTQGTINAVVAEFFRNREPRVTGVTALPSRDSITQHALIAVVETIIIADNAAFSSLNFSTTLGGAVLFVYTLGIGEKAKLTTEVSFVP